MKNTNNMIDFGGSIYYLDLDAFSKLIEPSGQKSTDIVETKDVKITRDESGKIIQTEEIISSRLRGKELDPSKLDFIKTMIEVLLDVEEIDTSLGAERALQGTSLSYQVAFNTLYNYGILKEK